MSSRQNSLTSKLSLRHLAESLAYFLLVFLSKFFISSYLSFKALEWLKIALKFSPMNFSLSMIVFLSTVNSESCFSGIILELLFVFTAYFSSSGYSF